MTSVLQRRLIASAGVLALAIVLLVFFDIAFLDRTLQPSNIVSLIGKADGWQASSAFLPVLNHEAAATDGFADLYASVLQFEPARYSMARDIREGQSPWWNPYSASGTLGPEVLVDIKFSPLTLLSAWLFDSSPASFDMGLLIIYAGGVFFVLLILRYIFQLDWLAAIAGAIVFLLNGFATPNLNTHIGQPYFFSPLLLFAVLYFAEKQNIGRWVFLVCAHAVLLSINILTTLSLVLIAVHVLGLAFFVSRDIDRSFSWRSVWLYISAISASFIFAILLLGFLWFPVLDSFFVTDMISDFDERTQQKPRLLENFISIFTPKLFWESHGNLSRVIIYPFANLDKSDSLIAHTGVIAAVLAGYAWPGFSKRHAVVILACLFLLVFPYARIFGMAGFVSHIPIIRSIGNQYWGCMSAVAFFMLVAFGVRNVMAGTTRAVLVIVILALQALAFGVLYMRLGFPEATPYFFYALIAIALFCVSCIAVLIISRRWIRGPLMAALMVFVMLAELIFYMNPVRPLRYSPIEAAPEFVGFLKKNIGDGRVINIGMSNTLYPEYGAMFGIKQADTQNPGLFPWYEKFFERHFGNDTFLFLALKGSNDNKRKKSVLQQRVLDDVALDVASIKYILVDNGAEPYLESLREKKYPIVYKSGTLTIFENTDYLHSAVLVPALVRSANLPPADRFDPHLAVASDDSRLLDDARRLGVPVRDASANSGVTEGVSGVANILSYRNDEVVVQASSSGPGVLVLSDTWHPAWRASVDGNEVHVGIVNETFRGIALTPGKHVVRFYYDLPALRYGIYTAITSAFLLLGLLIFSVLRMRENQCQKKGTVVTN